MGKCAGGSCNFSYIRGTDMLSFNRARDLVKRGTHRHWRSDTCLWWGHSRTQHRIAEVTDLWVWGGFILCRWIEYGITEACHALNTIYLQ